MARLGNGTKLDMTDINTNAVKIQEIFNKQETRTQRFEKQLVLNHKAYGNKIFKKRHNEYFDFDKQNRYKTPFLRLRDHHRWNTTKLTKAQKKQEVEWLEQRRKKKLTQEINYIDAYPDDSKPIAGNQLVDALQRMGEESNKLYESNQRTEKLTGTNHLIDYLAKVKLNRMDTSQIQGAIQISNLIKRSTPNDITQGNNAAASVQFSQNDGDGHNRSNSNHTEGDSLGSQSKSREGRRSSTQTNRVQSKTLFSFEERFRAFVGSKVLENMEILQEKRRLEYKDKVDRMLHANIDTAFTNVEFRQNVDINYQENLLTDLTHQFIHRAIEVGNKDQQQLLIKRKSASTTQGSVPQPKPNDQPSQGTITTLEEEPVIQSNGTIETLRTEPAPSAKPRGRRSTVKRKSSTGSQKSDQAKALMGQENFKPNLCLDFKTIKSLYDIKDREKLFYKVQFVLEHLDKERYKQFRAGKLSIAQCISRIEQESKNGVTYKVLDDMRNDLDPRALKKPTEATQAAYYEQVIEDRLLRGVKKRGIDPVLLKKTARNLSVQERCAKSMFQRPRTSQLAHMDTVQNQMHKAVAREQTFKRKEEIDAKRHADLVKAIQDKDARTKKVKMELAKQDPRAIYKESVESKLIQKRLYGSQFHYIPERYRQALIDEFKKEYAKQAQDVEEQKAQAKQHAQETEQRHKQSRVEAKALKEQIDFERQQLLEETQTTGKNASIKRGSASTAPLGLGKQGTTNLKTASAITNKQVKPEQTHTAHDSIDDFINELGNYKALDENTRNYLKRLKRTCPDARVTLPEGYYDTDEEEEKAKEKAEKSHSALIKTKIGGKHVESGQTTTSLFEVDGTGNLRQHLIQAESQGMKKSTTTKLLVKHHQAHHLKHHHHHGLQHPQKDATESKQFLGARSISVSSHGGPQRVSGFGNEPRSTARQVLLSVENSRMDNSHNEFSFEDELEQHQESAKLDRDGQGLSLRGIPQGGSGVRPKHIELAVHTSINSTSRLGEDISTGQQQLKLAKTQSQSIAVIKNFAGTPKDGGIIAQPRGTSQKRKSSVPQSGATSGVGILRDDRESGLVSEGAVADQEVHSNFPLKTFYAVAAGNQNGEIKALDEPEMISDREQSRAISVSPQRLSNTACGGGGVKRTRAGSHYGFRKHSSSQISQHQRYVQKLPTKEMSQETLVLGGLVNSAATRGTPQSVQRTRTQSAMSKEYHQRHTRHIRGQSAMTRQDDHRKTKAKASSGLGGKASASLGTQSTKLTRQGQSISGLKSSTTNLGGFESAVNYRQGGFSTAPSAIPESVIEWYNEAIGPIMPIKSNNTTTAVPFGVRARGQVQGNRDYGPWDDDAVQEPPMRPIIQQSEVQYKPKVVSTGKHTTKAATKTPKKRVAKPVAVVQQSALQGILNQDINAAGLDQGGDVDFAFTVNAAERAAPGDITRESIRDFTTSWALGASQGAMPADGKGLLSVQVPENLLSQPQSRASPFGGPGNISALQTQYTTKNSKAVGGSPFKQGQGASHYATLCGQQSQKKTMKEGRQSPLEEGAFINDSFDMTQHAALSSGVMGSIHDTGTTPQTATIPNNYAHSNASSTGYNWLTGASMTAQNATKLHQVTSQLQIGGVSRQGGAVRLLANDRAPRQLLVNESVLRRNQFYRKQQNSAIQTHGPLILAHQSSIINGPSPPAYSQKTSTKSSQQPTSNTFGGYYRQSQGKNEKRTNSTPGHTSFLSNDNSREGARSVNDDYQMVHQSAGQHKARLSSNQTSKGGGQLSQLSQSSNHAIRQSKGISNLN